MFLEVLLAVAANVSLVFNVMAFAAGIALVIATVILCSCSADSTLAAEQKKEELIGISTVWWRIMILFLILLPIGSLPKVDDLWKVRVGLIKLELASPENIKAGSETIERIAQKLECRYIGCEEAKAKKEEKKD